MEIRANRFTTSAGVVIAAAVAWTMGAGIVGAIFAAVS